MHWFLEVNFWVIFVGGIRMIVIDGVIDFDIFADIEHIVVKEWI